MGKMVTLNELSPAMSHLVGQTFGGAADAQQLEKAQQQVDTVLRFFEGLLGDNFFFAVAMELAYPMLLREFRCRGCRVLV